MKRALLLVGVLLALGASGVARAERGPFDIAQRLATQRVKTWKSKAWGAKPPVYLHVLLPNGEELPQVIHDKGCEASYDGQEVVVRVTIEHCVGSPSRALARYVSLGPPLRLTFVLDHHP